MAATWTSNTETGPAANQVIVEYVAPAYGTYYFSAIMNATFAASFLIQHRNAANDATLSEQEASIFASVATELGPYSVVLQEDERLRIAMKYALPPGRVSCSLFVGPA